MASWLGKNHSSSVYLLPPHGTSRLDSCDEEWCNHIPESSGADLDHGQPSVWLNDLVNDYVHEKSCQSGQQKSGEKPLNSGDVAAVERTLQVSSCALILALLYAERLEITERTPADEPVERDGNYREQPQAPACEFDDDTDADCDTPEASSGSSTRLSAADLFLVCVLTANKYLYDEGEPDALWNSDIASPGRRKKQRMNELERIFLNMIEWRLYVSPQEFTAFLRRVERTLALRAINRAGGRLHYQDADRLWDAIVAQGWVVIRVLWQLSVKVATIYAVLVVVILITPSFVARFPQLAPLGCNPNLSTPLANTSHAEPYSEGVFRASAVDTVSLSWEPSSDRSSPGFGLDVIEHCHACTGKSLDVEDFGWQNWAAQHHNHLEALQFIVPKVVDLPLHAFATVAS